VDGTNLPRRAVAPADVDAGWTHRDGWRSGGGAACAGVEQPVRVALPAHYRCRTGGHAHLPHRTPTTFPTPTCLPTHCPTDPPPILPPPPHPTTPTPDPTPPPPTTPRPHARADGRLTLPTTRAPDPHAAWRRRTRMVARPAGRAWLAACGSRATVATTAPQCGDR